MCTSSSHAPACLRSIRCSTAGRTRRCTSITAKSYAIGTRSTQASNSVRPPAPVPPSPACPPPPPRPHPCPTLKNCCAARVSWNECMTRALDSLRREPKPITTGWEVRTCAAAHSKFASSQLPVQPGRALLAAGRWHVPLPPPDRAAAAGHRLVPVHPREGPKLPGVLDQPLDDCRPEGRRAHAAEDRQERRQVPQAEEGRQVRPPARRRRGGQRRCHPHSSPGLVQGNRRDPCGGGKSGSGRGERGQTAQAAHQREGGGRQLEEG